jgi:uncharacterized protein (TIGR03437 family)
MYDRQSGSRRFVPLFYFVMAFGLLSPIEGQQITSVVSAANDQAVISPNSLATIFGVNLAQETASATLNASGALPTAIGGTSVSIGGQTAPLLYVSPQQINFLVPANTPLGTVNVSVKSPTSQSPISGSVSVASVSPGVFTIPCLRPSRGAVLNGVTYSLEPFQAVTPQNSISDKRTRLSLFGTGLRYAGNATFNPNVVNVANAITAQATDSLGVTRTLPVEYAGPAPDYLGLDQVNVVLPAELQDAGLVYLRLRSGNAISNSVSVVMSKSLAAGLGSEQNFNIMTVAGSGAPGYADLGSAIRALLQNPTGVALDGQHNLYIASGGSHVVQMVSTDGIMTTVAGTGNSGSSGDGGPAIQALLRDPVSLAVDPSGNLYVADPEDNKIRRIAADGTISTFAGTGAPGFSGDGGQATAAELSSPSAVAVDPYGALVIADTGNNRIRRVTSDGVIDTIAGTGKASFSGDGGPGYLAGLNAPDSVAVGADGTTYVADEGNQRIRRIYASGGIDSLMAGGLTPIVFQSPIRLAVDANQQLFISDSPDARIQVMGSACQLNPVAGTGIPGFAGDGGLATGAQVNGPSSLAPDVSGDVFFADSNNNRIRRLYQGGCDSPANISFNPEPAMTGMTVNGLVRLSCPAAQDTALALSGNGLDLPGTVSIASGQSSGSFSFQVPSVDMTTGFPVTASNPQYSATGTLFAEPAGTSNAGALSMAVEPSSQIGGGPVSGIVTLAGPAPAGGTQVSLASNDPAAKVAGDALIPQGQMGAEFAVVTSPVTQPAAATITGNSGGVTTSTPLSILTGGLSTLGSLSIAPSSVNSGQSATGSVTLASAAPASGVQVNLASSNPAATVPASVTIPAGQTTGTFPVSTSTVSSPTAATITASSANNASATVTVNPASGGQSPASGTIASFSIAPSSVTSGQTATGTVTLASAAPASGVQVNLASSNPAATVPASITIPSGQTTGTFPVSTSTVSSSTTATITASSANTASATLTVNPAAQPACIGSISFSRSEVIGGNPVSGTVTLKSPAPAGGQPVSLSSSSASAGVPATVTVPAGQSSTGFTVSTQPVLSTQNPVISGSTGACAGSSAALTILPSL